MAQSDRLHSPHPSPIKTSEKEEMGGELDVQEEPTPTSLFAAVVVKNPKLAFPLVF